MVESDLSLSPAEVVEEQQGVSPWLRFAVLVLVITGGILRLGSLQTVFFWHDEVHTGFAISGTVKQEIRNEFGRSSGIPARELVKYQFPRRERGVVDTLIALAQDEPRHPPLYFVVARWWTMVFGSSIFALRSLSAVLGMLALPLCFLVCRQLTANTAAPWVAVGLVAISPIHVVYSQEARQYMLWIDLVLLATWILIRAMELSRKRSPETNTWFTYYAVVLTLAFYTHILTGAVALAHAVAVFVGERLRFTSGVRVAAVAMIGAGTLHIPWVVVVLRDAATGRGWIMWAEGPSSIPDWIRRAAGEASRVFMDRYHGFYISDAREWNLRWLLLALALLCATWGVSKCSRHKRVYLAMPILAYVAPFLLSDILRGAWRSTVIRYEWPAVVMVQIAMAIGLADLMGDRRNARRFAGAAVSALLVLTGVVSGVRHWQAYMCWNKSYGEDVFAVARHLEDVENPLVLVDDLGGTSYGHIFSLAHRVTNRIEILAVSEPFQGQLDPRGREVFVWHPTSGLGRWLRSAGWSHEATSADGLHHLIPPNDGVPGTVAPN